MNEIVIGTAFFAVGTILYIYDKRNSAIYKKLDDKFFERFGKYPNFYWLENFSIRYWSRIRPGVYGKLLQIKTYDANNRLLKNLSEEEFTFIKEIPIETQKIIIRQMLFKLYLIYGFFIFTIVMLIVDGGIDYLFQPVTRDTIRQGLSLR